MKEQLIAAFVSAQEHFLKSEISRIQTEWQDVTSFAYKADWGPAQREMIQTAYMRLSQIASTPESTKKYLRAAYEFSPSYEPDDKLFPPPLVEQYQELRKSRVVQTLSMKNFSGFSILYVNGVRTDIESTDAIEIAAGPKRMTLLSPMYTPVTRVLDAESLLTFNPDRSHLPQALKSQGPRLAANDLAPKPNLDIGPDFTLTGARSRESKPFYQKPRFWVITAAVAGAVLVYNSQKDKGEESHSPTHTQGL
jgi:hypothetical protein